MAIAGSIYKTKRWERLSKRTLARDPVCVGCEDAPSRIADHIVPLTKGGAPFDQSNLQALCIACHNDKTAADALGIRWAMPKHRGCNADGSPRDPAHPWHHMGVQSLQSDRGGPAGASQIRLVANGSQQWD